MIVSLIGVEIWGRDVNVEQVVATRQLQGAGFRQRSGPCLPPGPDWERRFTPPALRQIQPAADSLARAKTPAFLRPVPAVIWSYRLRKPADGLSHLTGSR